MTIIESKFKGGNKMEKIGEIIKTWITMKGISKITKMVGAVLFVLMLFMVGGIPAKIVVVLCFMGFFKCIL